MLYVADRSTKEVPVIFLPGSHLQFVESDSTVNLNMTLPVEGRAVLDEVYFYGRRHSVQSFVKFVRVAQNGYWPLASRYCRVFPVFNMAMILILS